MFIRAELVTVALNLGVIAFLARTPLTWASGPNDSDPKSKCEDALAAADTPEAEAEAEDETDSLENQDLLSRIFSGHGLIRTTDTDMPVASEDTRPATDFLDILTLTKLDDYRQILLGDLYDEAESNAVVGEGEGVEPEMVMDLWSDLIEGIDPDFFANRIPPLSPSGERYFYSQELLRIRRLVRQIERLVQGHTLERIAARDYFGTGGASPDQSSDQTSDQAQDWALIEFARRFFELASFERAPKDSRFNKAYFKRVRRDGQFRAQEVQSLLYDMQRILRHALNVLDEELTEPKIPSMQPKPRWIQ